MSQKGNIDPHERGFYFSRVGKSVWDGTSFERPKSTMQEAIDAAQALDPPPANTALAVVTAAQGGSFSAGFTLFDFIQINGQNVSITENTTVAIEMASFLTCKLTSVSNAQAASIVFNIDGQTFISLECDLINIFGTGGAKGLNITGSCDNLFVELKQMTLVADDSIGINITSTSPTPIDINIDTVSMDGNDSTFMIYDPVNSTDVCICGVSSITSNSSTGTSGYIGRNGILIVVQNGILSCETPIKVESGAVVIFSCEDVIGDIIIEPGGTLIANVANFSGAITNDGDLRGRIGDTFFGPKIFTSNDPDTTALLTHIVTGTNGGSSQTFITNRDPKGNIAGNPGSFAIRVDGVNSRIYQHRGTSDNNTDWVNISDSRRDTVLSASDFTTQNPAGTDAPMQIKFGSAQFGSSDPIELSAAGVITANVADQYYIDVTVQFGRSGAGQSSRLFFRILVNGTQDGSSLFAEIDNANTNLAIQFNGRLDLVPDDVVIFELVRDSTGFDSGGLFSNTSVVGWNPSASAQINISRRILL